MKQVFFGLIALNLCYLLFQQMSTAGEVAPGIRVGPESLELLEASREQASEDTPAPAFAPAAIASASLAGAVVEPAVLTVEKADEEANEKADKTAAQVVASPDAQPTSECVIAGPFPSRSSGQEFVSQLASTGIDAQLQPRDVAVLPDYMVYVGPESSEAEARAVEAGFKLRQMDSHIISVGALQNAISLGVFSRGPLAQSLRQQLEDDGYTAQIAIITRNRTGFQVLTSLPQRLRAKLVAADTPMIDCPQEIAQR